MTCDCLGLGRGAIAVSAALLYSVALFRGPFPATECVVYSLTAVCSPDRHKQNRASPACNPDSLYSACGSIEFNTSTNPL